MYREDSLFTLAPIEQAGVVALSTTMAVLLILGLRRLLRGRGLGWRVLLGCAGFWLFVWLSPQIYYTYYRAIIPGLPAQIVTSWPDLLSVWQLLSFTDKATLSDHGKGVLGWLCLAASLLPPRKGRDHDP